MKNKEEMYEYLEWLIKKIEENKENLIWIGSGDCGCISVNDTRTEEDIEKGCALVDLCEYIKNLNPILSRKITEKYNIFEETKDGENAFISCDCVCFKYKDKYYFMNYLPYFEGDTILSIINEKIAKFYGYIQL